MSCAPTLQSLKLEFERGEVHGLPGCDVPFPALENLTLNAGGAHGENGVGIHNMLKNAPSLDTLDF